MNATGKEKMKRSVRVVTYNVLSSSLCSASYFTNTLDPKYCDSKYRFDGLVTKLEPEIEKNAIICLQEVSLAWSGKLHTFLESKDYDFIVSNYGNRFNGFMGVGIAFPRKQYILAHAELTCAPETKVGGWTDPDSKRQDRERQAASGKDVFALVVAKKALTSVTMPFMMLWMGFGNLLSNLNKIWFPRERSEFVRRTDGAWDLAKNRVNTMVCLRLRHRDVTEEDGMDFLVATYHMPCQFWEPATMTIHTAICLQKLQKEAEGKYPHILAGDFNFKPHSPQFEFVTKGSFDPIVRDPDDPEVNGKSAVPPAPLYPNDPFTFTLPRGPLRSAYTEVLGKEPRFTNYAMTKDQQKPFCGTLDYIFFRDGEKQKGKVAKLSATGVSDVDSICESILSRGLKSLPSDTEYSDHLLIAADLELFVE